MEEISISSAQIVPVPQAPEVFVRLRGVAPNAEYTLEDFGKQRPSLQTQGREVLPEPLDRVIEHLLTQRLVEGVRLSPSKIKGEHILIFTLSTIEGTTSAPSPGAQASRNRMSAAASLLRFLQVMQDQCHLQPVSVDQLQAQIEQLVRTYQQAATSVEEPRPDAHPAKQPVEEPQPNAEPAEQPAQHIDADLLLSHTEGTNQVLDDMLTAVFRHLLQMPAH